MARKNVDEERREKLRNRTNQAGESKSGGGKNFGVLDLEGFDDVLFIKAINGWNLWDIIPFVISEEWYSTLRDTEGNTLKLTPGNIDYKLEIAIHRRVGINEISVVCLKKTFGQACFNCDQITSDLTKKEKDSLKSTWRSIYNIINTEEINKGAQIFDVSEFLFEQKMIEQAKKRKGGTITFSDLKDGNTVAFIGKDKSRLSDSGESYSYKEFGSFKFEDRGSYDNDILEQVYPLDSMLRILTYKEQERIYLGLDEDDEIDDPGQQEIDEENKNKNEDDIPLNPDGGTAEENECPSGGLFGADVNELDDCPDCPQETFDTCCDEKDRLDEEEKAKKDKPKSRTRTAKPKKRVRGNK